ncbi:MAG TPA: DUF3536 domain-containing protein [Elusimicrobiota bacterium]|nr:DUF3536 domain-containing protein [Elusimicrobiota bacterium]
MSTPLRKYICIHGHFYQPPRESPALEEIEVEDSARPAHDWNERITAECYAPNTASRILDAHGRIGVILNNYAKMSFNFGPTLLIWLQKHTPDVYKAILAADAVSREQRGGHGNAMAQVYNHVIMPLASRRDKVTQVVWGIQDFRQRFGRMPEGMWLAETAVNTETLEVLADMGIQFTVLSPDQAMRVRPLTSDIPGSWNSKDETDVRGGRIDPSRAYRWLSPRGYTMNLFFYDAPVSRSIAFEGILNSGETFFQRLLNGFSDMRRFDQLVHVATDGESYGHHHRFGDMALAYTLNRIEKSGVATLTNYGEFLAKHPPEMEVEIAENSSWSCAHGVERWRSDCGCRLGVDSRWNQRWRRPLRESLNWLKEKLDFQYESQAGVLLKDSWLALNDYIGVMMDRSPESVDRFFQAHQLKELTDEERVTALKLLELERYAHRMFTSCGWFFDEISGIETVLIIKFAARAIQLSQECGGDESLESEFVQRLREAESNIPELGHGAEVYRRYVKPVLSDLRRVTAHFAIHSLLEDWPDETTDYCYRIRREDYRKETAGGSTMAIGRAQVTSLITHEKLDVIFAVLHVSGSDFQCTLRAPLPAAEYEMLKESIFRVFKKASVSETVRLLGHHFEPKYYSLQDLFLEERRRALGWVTRDILKKFDGTYRMMLEDSKALMDSLAEHNAPIPEAFLLAAQYVYHSDVERVLDQLHADPQSGPKLVNLDREARRLGISLDKNYMTHRFKRHIDEDMRKLVQTMNPAGAQEVIRVIDIARELNLPVNLWEAENLFYGLWQTRLSSCDCRDKLSAADWKTFHELGERLHFRLPEIHPTPV